MNIIAIIPARMESSRFPGKPMALIGGMPMIGHVFHRTRMSKRLTDTVVATCNSEIYDYITGIGGGAIMTSNKHERASDRAAEAMLKWERETGKRADMVVMVQGDEPMVVPEMIDEAVNGLLSEKQAKVVNLMAPITLIGDFEDPNEVKVVVDPENYALYFSREPIPSRKKGGKNIPMLKQVCIIPFLRDYLLEFNELSPTPLEIIESVDMMRVIEHGRKVKMVRTSHDTCSVDTPEDLHHVETLMRSDIFVGRYTTA